MLKYPPVAFSGRQALAIAQGFDRARSESGYVIHACAILPEHVHSVLGRNEERPVERVVKHLKTRATQQLSTAGLWAADKQPVWGENCWKVFSMHRRGFWPRSNTWKRIQKKRGSRSSDGRL